LLSNIHLQQKDYPALLQDIDQYLKLDPDSPAGVRAKELREQVQQKMAAEHPVPATAKP
jgi:regulator of sirC expression with transglutaminase-like and TPR domain